MAVQLDHVAISHGDAASGSDTAHIVATKIKQHQMLGALLGVGEQAVAVFGIL